MDLRRKTEMIVIHCAATKPSMDIGDHYIIKRDGLVEVGRPEAFQGAHAPSVNSKSIAICLIGGMAENGEAENNFTLTQFLSLKDLIKKLIKSNSNIKQILGHCDVQDNKPNCPGFHLTQWLYKEDINVA